MAKALTALPKGDYTVYCHRCYGVDLPLKRSQATLHGSPDFGGLWHCSGHANDCPLCPHGADYCDADCKANA